MGIVYSVPGHVRVRTSSVLSKLLLEEVIFYGFLWFSGDVFKVEQGVNCLHFMYFRMFKAISNAWNFFPVQALRKLKFTTLFNQLS